MQAAIHDLMSHWMRFLSFLPSLGKVVMAMSMATERDKDIGTLRLFLGYSRKIKQLHFVAKCLHLRRIYLLFFVMFKRFIFILILLTIAFFVYRKINPE